MLVGDEVVQRDSPALDHDPAERRLGDLDGRSARRHAVRDAYVAAIEVNVTAAITATASLIQCFIFSS